MLLRLLADVGVYDGAEGQKPRIHQISRRLTVQGGLVTAHNVVRVLALPVPITRLLGLRIGLELVDRLAGMFLRLIGDVGVVDGGLCAFVSYDTMARCTKTGRTLWPPIWRVGRDMFTIGGLRCRWVVRVVGRVR